MKMKHKYPVGTRVTFLITFGDDKQTLSLEGIAAYHGTSDEGKEGVGFRLTQNGEQTTEMQKVVEKQCRNIFGERLACRIMAMTEGFGDDIR